VIVCVLAKEPRPGFVKTRLCPPFTPDQAAELAEACLHDTMDAVSATPDSVPLVVLDGRPGSWLRSGTGCVPQVDGAFGDRLQAAVDEGFRRLPGGPVVVIGMDTPQVTPTLLVRARRALDPGDGSTGDESGSTRAVLGPATDGGYWLIGFSRPVAGAFAGVLMSASTTGAAQLARLEELGCRTVLIDELTDVDDAVSARRVADAAPGTGFARALARLGPAR
jgi:glycosyltransferase A (GT-A) superfamily protein (DUF2064 family)